MTTIELNSRKAEMIRTILNDVNSEAVVGELENLIRKLVTVQPPCLYTSDEIKASAKEAIRQRKAGLHTSHEEMKRLIDSASRQ